MNELGQMGQGQERRHWDVVVVGAGMAGLSAAVRLARAGQKVMVLEKAAHAGGRGSTTIAEGARLNMGAHALYPAAQKLLHEVGVDPAGGAPKLNGAMVFREESGEDRLLQPAQLFLGSFLNWHEKVELIRFYGGLRKIDLSGLHRVTLQDYLETALRNRRIREFVLAMVRLSTYCHAPRLMSAAVAIRQLQNGKVLYVDGGWGTIIEGLKAEALHAGAVMMEKAPVARISGVCPQMSVTLKDGSVVTSRYVLSTVAPQELPALLEQPLPEPQAELYRGLVPVRAACLDLVTDVLPNPKNTFALGINRPLYYSNHSAAARLTDNRNHSVIHLMRYAEPGEPEDADRNERELESFMDLLQPGWRRHVVSRRFLPHMTVSHAVAAAESGGLSGRPSVKVPGRTGLFVAGDWAGDEGLLLHASLASASKAARCIIEEAN